jgi:glycosyltransferase involved in cell wall biosynthesis
MKITIITVAYNAAATIADTLKSVAAQNWPDIEHIVVDGASSDATLEVIARNAHSSLHVISEPDEGLYDAMNKGVAAATGDIIGFLNADDFYCRSDALNLVAKPFQEPSCRAVGAAIAIVRPDRIDGAVRAYDATSFRPWMLRFGHMPPHPGFFIRRSTFLEVGSFATCYRIGGDFDWMVRFFLLRKFTANLIQETIVGLRQGGVSTAGFGSHASFNREACRILVRHGYSAAEALIWMKYAAKAFQWVRPAVAYPPPDSISLLPLLQG